MFHYNFHEPSIGSDNRTEKALPFRKIKIAKPRAILTNAQVITIYRHKLASLQPGSARPCASAIAGLYGISEKAVRDIWTGRTWSAETSQFEPSRPVRTVAPLGRPKGSKDSAPRRRRWPSTASLHPPYKGRGSSDPDTIATDRCDQPTRYVPLPSTQIEYFGPAHGSVPKNIEGNRSGEHILIVGGVDRGECYTHPYAPKLSELDHTAAGNLCMPLMHSLGGHGTYHSGISSVYATPPEAVEGFGAWWPPPISMQAAAGAYPQLHCPRNQAAALTQWHCDAGRANGPYGKLVAQTFLPPMRPLALSTFAVTIVGSGPFAARQPVWLPQQTGIGGPLSHSLLAGVAAIPPPCVLPAATLLVGCGVDAPDFGHGSPWISGQGSSGSWLRPAATKQPPLPGVHRSQ
jgi:hypothetical protein